MNKKIYPSLISERECREWITGCPAQVKKTRIELPSEGAEPQIFLTTAKCGDFSISSVLVTLEIQNNRREVIGKLENIVVTIGESQPIPCPYVQAMYATSIIEEVTFDSKTWKNISASSGAKLPEQDLFWTTDPLYDQIQRECEGVVNAKYKPDRIEGAWRCTCGQINLSSSEKCGACSCSLAWLEKHLERSYLEEQKKISDAKTEKELVREKKIKSREPSDKVKAILIFGGLVALIVLVLLTFTLIIPSIRYNSATSLAEKGEYDRSIEIFNDLGDFRDAEEQVYAVTYKKAQVLTGLDDVYMTTTSAEPWFKIDESGLLSFNKDTYEKAGGTWNHFVVPDMVNGVIVTALERNFFINCNELTVVTISDCVLEIGEQAFLNCEMLHTVNWGKNVKSIGPRVFIDCHSLEEMNIPDTVESLGARTFNNCTNLKKIVLGTGITQLNDYLFSMCTSLESVTLCSPVTKIGNFAFSECEKLEYIFCRFPESDWTKPEVGTDNAPYDAAKISFNN